MNICRECVECIQGTNTDGSEDTCLVAKCYVIQNSITGELERWEMEKREKVLRKYRLCKDLKNEGSCSFWEPVE